MRHAFRNNERERENLVDCQIVVFSSSTHPRIGWSNLLLPLNHFSRFAATRSSSTLQEISFTRPLSSILTIMIMTMVLWHSYSLEKPFGNFLEMPSTSNNYGCIYQWTMQLLRFIHENPKLEVKRMKTYTGMSRIFIIMAMALVSRCRNSNHYCLLLKEIEWLLLNCAHVCILYLWIKIRPFIGCWVPKHMQISYLINYYYLFYIFAVLK